MQPVVPNNPGSFKPYKLGTPNGLGANLTPAICYLATVTQTGTAAPVFDQSTS